jgi:hypothetical protein
MDRAPKSRQQPPRTFLARSLIDIAVLDVRIQEQVARYGSLKDFGIAVWCQELDAMNCNWNARIERFQGDSSSDSSWWHIVPLMRERFNLV